MSQIYGSIIDQLQLAIICNWKLHIQLWKGTGKWINCTFLTLPIVMGTSPLLQLASVQEMRQLEGQMITTCMLAMRSSMEPSHNLWKISSVSPHAITVINPERHIMPTNRVHNVSLHTGIPPSNINLEPHKYKSLELYYPSSTHEDASHRVLGHPHYSESDTNWLCPSTSCCHQEHLHYDTLSSVVASSSDMKLSTLSTCTTHIHQGIHDQQLWQQKLTKISPHC